MLFKKFLVLARKCILNSWIRNKPPTVTEWYTEIFKVLPMERKSAKLRGDDIWQPLIDYLPKDLSVIIVRGSGSLG